MAARAGSLSLSGEGGKRMKKILFGAGALVSVLAAVFCVLRRRKKHYGSPC